MKKVLLAAAVASLGLSAAQAAPTLYGKLNVSLDYVDNYDYKNNNETQLNSNASRIGVKGEEKLTDNLSAVYMAEWQVNTDGDGTDLGMRNRFLGVKIKDIGTLKAGFYDSNFKNIDGKAQNTFKDDNLLDNKTFMYGEDRLKNSVSFETDKNLIVPGLQFNITAQQGEDSSSSYTTKKRNGFGSGISTSLTYDNKDYGLSAGVAGNFGVPGTYNALSLSSIESDAYRLTGALDFTNLGLNGLVLGALWQHAEPSDSPSVEVLAANKLNTAVASMDEEAWTINAAYSIANTPWVLKAMYGSSKTDWDAGSRKIDQYGVNVDYFFNKQTRVYGVLAQQKRNWLVDDKKTVVGVGMEYNF